jgi:hypothetical protein
MCFEPWYERFPGRLEQEKEAYRTGGFPFELDDDLLATSQVVVFSGEIETSSGPHRLRLVYPASFPELRPFVFSDDRTLARHQNPYGKNLCVIAHEQSAWRNTDTGADMVRQAVSLFNASHAGPETVAAQEVDAPEPASVWYPYSPNTSFLVLGDFTVPGAGAFGSFTIELSNPHNLVDPQGSPRHLQAILTGARAADRGSANVTDKELWRLPDEARWAMFSDRLEGAWFRSPVPPPALTDANGDPGGYAEFVAWAKANHPKRSYWIEQTSRKNKGAEVFAVVYPNEGPKRGEFHDAWLVGISGLGKVKSVLLRPHRWGQQDRLERIPSLSGLQNKKVLVVGLGALGSPLATGLARAGVGQLGFVDHDVVEPGPLVRQDYDIRDVGLPKAYAAMLRAKAVNPYIVVHSFESSLGTAPSDPAALPGTGDSLVAFAELASQYDLLVSTTGETYVEHSLNEIGAALGIPRVFTWVLNGAWGGCVFRALSGQACYECLRYGYNDLPVPQYDSEDVPLYARGCGFPTFAGTGFDALAVADLAVRQIVQTLLQGSPDGYPDATSNLINWSSRGSAPGAWPGIEHVNVPRDGRCRVCQKYRH